MTEESKNQVYLTAYALICTRLNLCETAREVAEELAQQYGICASNIVEDFICIFGNYQMQKVFKAICAGEKVTKEQSQLVDGLGLTPLHYAIILQNKEAISDILFIKDWSQEQRYRLNQEVKNVYSYSMLAYMRPEVDHPLISAHTIPELKVACDTIRTLEKQKDEMQKAHMETSECIREAEYRLHRMESENADFDDIEQVKQSIFDLHESSRNLLSALEEMPEQITEAEKERDRIYKIILAEDKKIVERLNNDSNPLIRLLLQLFRKPEKFEEYISTMVNSENNLQMKMYQCGECYFLSPDSISLELPYRTVCIVQGEITDGGNLEKENSDYRPWRTFGSSWFSPKAHTDPSALKDEYRQLAKNITLTNVVNRMRKAFFQEIQNEYEDIRNELSQ